ncbi:MAG: hypothetical protein AB8B91_23885 [Rubripirellula sp.]
MECTFIVFKPVGPSDGWTDTPTMIAAQALPNVTFLEDVDALVSRQLGLEVSGAVLVVNDRGEVLLRGGITGSRSCEIENPGEEALAKIAMGANVAPLNTPVFGCPFSDPKTSL